MHPIFKTKFYSAKIPQLTTYNFQLLNGCSHIFFTLSPSSSNHHLSTSSRQESSNHQISAETSFLLSNKKSAPFDCAQGSASTPFDYAQGSACHFPLATKVQLHFFTSKKKISTSAHSQISTLIIKFLFKHFRQFN